MHTADRASPSAEAGDPVFAAGGEMGRLCRRKDWSATPLGPAGAWPQSLRTAAGMVVAQRVAQSLCWGRELVQIYNDAFRELAGSGHPAALGRPLLESRGEIHDQVVPLLQRALAGETAHCEDVHLSIARRGRVEEATFTISCSPVRAESGEVGGVLVTACETTDRVRAGVLRAEYDALVPQLQVERSRLEHVFEQAPTFLAVLRGPEHVFELANDAYIRLVGHREVRGRPVRQALPEVVEQGFLDLLDRVLETGEPFIGREVAVQLARTPGAPPELRFVDFSYLPLVEADGTRSGVIAHGADVTAAVLSRRRVEEQASALEERAAELERQIAAGEALAAELQQSRARLRLALDVARLGDWEIDLRSGSANRSLRHDQIFGYEELLPEWSYEIFLQHVHPDDRAYVDERFQRTFAGGEDWEFECRIVWRDGSTRWIWAQGAIFRETDGEPARLLGLVDDITDRKQAEQDLIAARDEAEEANRAKADFLASMSHELRTPLNAIGGYVDLLDLGIHGPMNEAQRLALSRVTANQRHLLSLINDVLAFAKVEAGQVELDLRPLLAMEMLSGVEPLVAPLAGVKGIALSVREYASPLYLRGDAERVRQILLNLVGNAIKFTPAGGWVFLACEGGAEWVEIHVRDNGPGIPVVAQRRIFDPFVQAERSLSTPQEGVGLGLAISRDLARAMGGDLGVASAPGEGSTFTLRLPRCGPPAEPDGPMDGSYR